MLTEEGHTVYHYGVEGSDPVCTEHVSVVDDATFQRVHGVRDWRRDGFLISRETDAYRLFAANAIRELAQRAEPGDFLLCPFGLDHEPIARHFPELIVVESGIGYEHTFALFRVWESYGWMAHAYGREGRSVDPLPAMYDAIIPNAYDVADFPFQAEKDDYYIFLGRPTALKGRQIAIDVCRELGVPLYVAGQGDRTVPDGVTHLGVLSIEERAHWVGHAKALFAPTLYFEPWGGVAVEAQLYGTPVITTDWGGFAENVVHGVTGYRCRTFEQFLFAARSVDRLDPAACRQFAAANFSLERVGPMYQEYFEGLARLHADPAGWYARNPERTQLDWLVAQ